MNTYKRTVLIAGILMLESMHLCLADIVAGHGSINATPYWNSINSFGVSSSGGYDGGCGGFNSMSSASSWLANENATLGLAGYYWAIQGNWEVDRDSGRWAS